ncbi:MAG: tyrosine-type recombinase/integrase [Thermodesulfobacteriota bacterium]
MKFEILSPDNGNGDLEELEETPERLLAEILAEFSDLEDSRWKRRRGKLLKKEPRPALGGKNGEAISPVKIEEDPPREKEAVESPQGGNRKARPERIPDVLVWSPAKRVEPKALQEKEGPMDLEQRFLDFCRFNLALSENTLRSYEYDIREYLEWLERGGLALESVKIGDIDDFQVFLRKKGNCVSSINQKAYCIKSFYRWLQRREIVNKNPMEFFRNIKGGKRLVRFLTPDQQEALLKEAKKNGSKPAWMRERDRLLMLFLIDTGLRVHEVSKVRLEDLDLKEQIIRVIGKGDKERIAVISDRLKLAMERYLKRIEKLSLGPIKNFAGFAARGLSAEDVGKEIGKSRVAVRLALKRSDKFVRRPRTLPKVRQLWNKVRKSPQKLLFFNRKGKPLDTRYIFRIVKDLGQRIGLNDLHPHMLRHTFATNLRRKNADLLLMQEALGHSSVSTTQMYAHVADDQYRKTLRELLR